MAMLSRNKEGVREISDMKDITALKFLFYNSWYFKHDYFAWTSENKILCKDENGEFYECTLEESHLPENFPHLTFMEVVGAATFFNITKVTYRKKFCVIK